MAKRTSRIKHSKKETSSTLRTSHSSPSHYSLHSEAFVLSSLESDEDKEINVLILQSKHASHFLFVDGMNVMVKNVHDHNYLCCISKVDYVICLPNFVGHQHMWDVKKKCAEVGKTVLYSKKRNIKAMLSELKNVM